MRDAFLLDPDLVFLNHGSYGACPKPVFAAYQRWQVELERNPVAFLGRRSAGLLAEARQRLGRFLGVPGEDLVFLPNATHGVNTVARSLKLQPGDEVLATDHEYGACDATWEFVCRQHGAAYRRVAVPLPFDASSWAQRLLDAATPRTRVIFASHISSATALIFPVRELCEAARRRGITTLIDGAHAPGQIALDLTTVGADFYTGNCHKWLCAPKGAAFLHARPERQAELDAAVVSWGYVAGSSGHTGFDAYTGSSAFERRLQWQGTRDLAAFLAVPAAIEFQRAHDWPAWRQGCHDMACALQRRVLARNGLVPIAPDEAFGQMVPIPVRTDAAAALREWLFSHHRIEVPVTQHAGASFVRVSVQAYNDEADLAALARALAVAGV
ncbi:MAG TPA: aminotransferase class V-fold PLP-dependent enzyme [Rubrivivax sp.]|nr:aminotransferase class V-fold PLP-dependent enzyme [Rubrivivax sp.]